MSDAGGWNAEPLAVGGHPHRWLDDSVVRRALYESITGHPELDPFTVLVSRHVREPARRALVLGCGGLTTEQHLVAMGLSSEVDVLDPSEETINENAALAARAGMAARIHFHVADLDHHKLPEESYDLAISIGSLHRVRDLESLTDQLERCLLPDALFIADEFVGPNRLQWTALQLEVLNRFLGRAVPSAKRRGLASRPKVEDVAFGNSSDYVRSRDVLPLLHERFRIVERIEYGGTLLNVLASQGLLRSPNDRGMETVRRVLQVLERALIREHVLPSDFILLAARRRKGASNPASAPREA